MKETLSKAEMTDYLLHIDINCAHRLDKGAKEYGYDGFMRRDNFKDIKEELYDFINYTKFQLIKIMCLESDLNHVTQVAEKQQQQDMQLKVPKCEHIWEEILDSPVVDTWEECNGTVKAIKQSLTSYFTCASCGAKKIEEVFYV